MKKNKIIKNLNFVILPLLLGVCGSLIWNIPFFAISGAIYFVLLVFLVPSVDFAFTDFNTIRINPYYRGRRKIILSNDILTLVLVLIALIVSVVLSYFYYR
ncbi:hypothetical protein ACJEEJ_13290 [Enterococcus faecalis]|uniref:hypothetical protein n=1 Tax=Enterococcus faecalis TaxID=1351 RepID=UPI00398494B0